MFKISISRCVYRRIQPVGAVARRKAGTKRAAKASAYASIIAEMS
jgi:hypothetical protein